MKMTKAKTINGYIAEQPKATQKLLKQLRTTIKKAAPKAEEKISYGLATFALHGNLVHFGAFAKHIGFYPAPSGITKFKKELVKYKTSKGAVQFPLDTPLPLSVITRIVKFRVKENNKRAK